MDELRIMIPSVSVREYIRKNNWVFSDRDKATLLLNAESSLQERNAYIEALAQETGDTELKAELEEFLRRREQSFSDFHENPGGQFIFVLRFMVDEGSGQTYSEIEPDAFFSTWKSAHDWGIREIDYPFQIEKAPIRGLAADTELLAVGNYNKYGDLVEFDDYADQTAYPDGTMGEGIRSAYVEVPYICERGDIVRIAGTDMYGVAEMSQEEWAEYTEKCRRMQNDAQPIDWSDVQVRVALLNPDGRFKTEYINPLRLESYVPEYGALSNSMDRVLAGASGLYRGNGSLDELGAAQEEYGRSLVRKASR